MITYQWTTAIMAVLVAGLILYLVRRNHMLGPYAIWWIVAATGVAALGIFPRFFEQVRELYGHQEGLLAEPSVCVESL